MKDAQANILKILIVEDEPHTSRRLAKLLQDQGCEVLAELPHGQALLEWLSKSNKADAIFLDIQMPGISGLEVLAEIPNPPPVVFVTGYVQYAIQAFEAAAMDYLLKPVSKDRLLITLDRLRKATVAPRSGKEIKQIIERSTITRFPVKVGDGIIFLDIRKVTHFEFEDAVVYAWAGERFHTSYSSLTEVEQAFPQAGFIRVQRHLIVRRDMILGLRPAEGGRVIVKLPGGIDLEASKGAAPTLRECLGVG